MCPPPLGGAALGEAPAGCGGRSQLSRPSASRPLSGPLRPLLLLRGLLPELGSDVPQGGGATWAMSSCGDVHFPSSRLGPLSPAPGTGPGGLQSTLLVSASSVPGPPPQALPCKVSRTFRAGSKVASLLLSLLLTSAHRKPSWVPSYLGISAQAEAAQNLRPSSPW